MGNKRRLYSSRHILTDAVGPLEISQCHCPGQCVFTMPTYCSLHGVATRTKHTLMTIFNGTGIYPTELRKVIDDTAILFELLLYDIADYRTLPGNYYIIAK